jgi:hypothetical protein
MQAFGEYVKQPEQIKADRCRSTLIHCSQRLQPTSTLGDDLVKQHFNLPLRTLPLQLSISLRLHSSGDRLKFAMREWLSGTVFTHWVTLNFHRQYALPAAQGCLQLWNMDVNSRLLRSRRYNEIPTCDLLFFVAFPEHTRTENVHWHLLVKVAAELHESFERQVGRMWKRVVPTGTSDIQRIGDSVEDHLDVQGYATKKFAMQASNESFVTSNMLSDGRRPRLGEKR